MRYARKRFSGQRWRNCSAMAPIQSSSCLSRKCWIDAEQTYLSQIGLNKMHTAKTAQIRTASTGMIGRARPEIVQMKGYSSARSLAGDEAGLVYLDANECAYEPFVGARNLARYSAQQPTELQRAFCDWLDVSSRNLTITRGADEAIDCLIRGFCEPGADNIVICPPTFAMYAQSAMLQSVEVRHAPLTADFGLDPTAIAMAMDEATKLVFVCSPNNPTGNVMNAGAIANLCVACDGRALVVVDETYIEYAGEGGEAGSLIPALEQFANLVILRTLSKSHAAAGIRCGCAVAAADITGVMQKVLAPYPVPQPVMSAALTILETGNQQRLAAKRAEVIVRRDDVITALGEIEGIIRVWPSDANFVLVEALDAAALCQRAREGGVVLRNQSHQHGVGEAVRISIGSAEEMARLLAALRGETIASAEQNRQHEIVRKTSETAISVAVNLDRAGPISIDTGIGFYDHMLDQIAKHAGFALTLECEGDLEIDPHHSIEDCAIALGQAIRGALGDKRGIGRYGFCLPMDEALVTVALDLSGRFHLDFKADFPQPMVGDLPCDMVGHVFRSLAENMQANLHIAVTGENCHHMVEACFKGFGRALRQAIRQDGSEMPSTKGTL
ncbi:MAG: histidinol-phosphate transaminase [SAR116 cluster bacterium]|nr:MAG: histidinol-phosphate transaminase [SAR116 cluster bacterium]